jgi:predicted ATP-dependent protease
MTERPPKAQVVITGQLSIDGRVLPVSVLEGKLRGALQMFSEGLILRE